MTPPYYRCPKCKATDRLAVVVTAEAELVQDNDGNLESCVYGDNEWGPSSRMVCRACTFAGQAMDFHVPERNGSGKGRRLFEVTVREDTFLTYRLLARSKRDALRIYRVSDDDGARGEPQEDLNDHTVLSVEEIP